ncbi:FG-GAP-like repeat-containing protein [Dyadobacter luticola]|uniref:T9SS type A sorting domain-containing protein n=1 Tax=Dyadobacter luticola TaxID=1979387 RepID=A0A5R9KRS3_9BACT|nr:FG-GAP-like repeat-containing protein [Dyadobacter luticola]TLU98818.1 T9SS type A sorting domain-containing protein [Dyadobacter luticola]
MQIRYQVLYLLCLIIVAASPLREEQKSKVSASAQYTVTALPHFPKIGKSARPELEAMPENTMAMIRQDIARQEYHISPGKEKGMLQSPNRKQNLRAYYKPGELIIENRVASIGSHFKLQLTTEGIFADGKKIFETNANAISENNGNTLRIKHQGFTEEYVNNEAGIRQNFIVDKAPKNTKKLQVRLLAKGLKVKSTGHNELQFTSYNNLLTYNDLKCWDADGKSLTASLAYTDGNIGIEVDVREAKFPVTIDPIVTNGSPGNANTILKENQSFSYFGNSVSTAGDVNGDGYSDLMIGAPSFDNGQNIEGAAFLYTGSANGINSVKSVKLQTDQPNTGYGVVANAGDVNGDGYSDIMVGAPFYNNGQVNEGAVFVYLGSSNGLTNAPSVILESNQASAQFGYNHTIATAGDINADGFSDIVVGSPLYSNGEAEEGAAFIYYGSASGITAANFSVVQSNHTGENMGGSVASAGDVNGDGFGDIVLAPGNLSANPQPNNASAYIYLGSSSGIGQSPGSVLTDYIPAMGSLAAGTGDVNGDGYSDIVLGDRKYSQGLQDRGALLVYHGSAKGIGNAYAAIITGDQKSGELGTSMSCAGDVNGDGYSDVLAVASLYDKGQNDEGVAFLYLGAASGLNTTASSTFEANVADAKLEGATSAGDVNGDGFSDVLIGSTHHNFGTLEEGAAFLFHGSASGISAQYTSGFSGDQYQGEVGFSVSSAGDINGDGYSDVVVGAPNFDNGESDEGIVRVYYGSGSGINFNSFSLIESNQAGAHLGISAASAGDVNGDGLSDLIVGALRYSNGQVGEGAFFIYHGQVSGIVTSPNTIGEGNEAELQMGFSVASAGDVNGDGYSDVIVGTLMGKAIVYYGSATGIKVALPSNLQGTINNGYLGKSVAGIGDFNGDGFADVSTTVEIYNAGADPTGIALIYFGKKAGIELTPSIKLNSFNFVCQSVAGAGDVNGDGLSDVLVGVPQFTSGQIHEGAALIFYGSKSLGDFDPSLNIESNQTSANMGYTVASAGDVNGDGYSDILIGSPYFDNDQNNEGAVDLYYGSQNGILNTVEAHIEGNQTSSSFGNAIACAGDVNADGYSDIILGAPFYDADFIDAGAAFLYYGNNAGLRNNLRLYNSDLNSIVDHNNVTDKNFGIGLFEKSFLGRNKGKLVWEIRKEGEGFSHSSPMTNSTQFTDQQPGFADLGTSGNEIKSLVAKSDGVATKVRARVKYDPVLAATGQVYGPWRYLSAYSSGGSFYQSTPLPVTLVSFTAEKYENNVNLAWVTANEENSESFEIQRSNDGKAWQAIGNLAAKVNSVKEEHYTFTDSTARPGQNFYRLKMIDLDQTYTFSRVRSVNMAGIMENMINLFPNPTTDKLKLQADQLKVTSLKIISAAGNIVLESVNPGEEVDVKQLKSGVYVVLMELEDGTSVSKSVVKK